MAPNMHHSLFVLQRFVEAQHVIEQGNYLVSLTLLCKVIHRLPAICGWTVYLCVHKPNTASIRRHCLLTDCVLSAYTINLLVCFGPEHTLEHAIYLGISSWIPTLFTLIEVAHGEQISTCSQHNVFDIYGLCSGPYPWAPDCGIVVMMSGWAANSLY